MKFDLLIHLQDVTDHGSALARIVQAWNDYFGIPLLFFSSKGDGQAVDDTFLKDRSQFGRLDDQISIRLRESRKRSACTLDIWFTNPTRAFYGDLNFIAAALPDQWFAQCGPSKAEQSIVKFVSSLVGIGILLDASFEHENVELQSPGHEIIAAIAAAYKCNIGHIAYFNSQFQEAHGGLTALHRAGFAVHAIWDHGCLAGIPLDYLPSASEAAWHLFDALENLGVFTRGSEPRLLGESHLSIKQIGGFLGAFEQRFGKAFAVRYSDGLRPAGPA